MSETPTRATTVTTLDEPGGVPLKVWGRLPEEGTLTQARHLAALPFAWKWVAVMPDAHVGYGMPIGGVLAALGRVIPHAVGLDIGCGVRVWRTNVRVDAFMPYRDAVLSDIQRSVPVGFDWHDRPQTDRTALFDAMPDIPALLLEREKAMRQVGSLGGGNHFLELQRDDDGALWAMVHSGSRNLGKQMATHYNDLAKRENAASRDAVPSEWGLAHVASDSGVGAEYLEVMTFCLAFARESRRLMAEAVQAAIARRFPGVEPDEALDVHHNYAAIETHYGAEVVVHRKGAVRASGQVAIPGSMGTHTWLGRGLDNPESFHSCSHGAGRRLGRKQAVRGIPVERVMSQMRERDVRLFKRKKGDIAEEAPEAYKDIDAVMAAQRDLVEPTVLLRPIGVVKG
jgi:tRNA-splicing ligase RtcB (3'-phosphate/5'-hydroxy nucleic acid ligase)